MRNAPSGTSCPAELNRDGCTKAQAYRGHTRGKRTRKESGDAIQEGEDVAQPHSRFEVDRHPTKVTEREMDLIRELYQVPDYLEFRLPGPSDQPT